MVPSAFIVVEPTVPRVAETVNEVATPSAIPSFVQTAPIIGLLGSFTPIVGVFPKSLPTAAASNISFQVAVLIFEAGIVAL